MKELQTTLERLSYVVVRRDREGKGRWYVTMHAGKRWIGVDRECTVVSIGRLPKLVER